MRLRELMAERHQLRLTALTGELELDHPIPDNEVASPGLVLAGYHARFEPLRLHVLGETEITYLESLDPALRRQRLESFFSFPLPAIFITKGLQPPEPLLTLAVEHRIPVLRTPMRTAEFYHAIKPVLEEAFAPRTTMHGSLADVYGVGLLFVGKSGIGKSECVLDLIERGHRLVADDVVKITRRGDVLIGNGHEMAQHHMEIRGVGLIDISALFGTRATRQQKRIEVVVQLEPWESTTSVDRTGLQREEVSILGLSIPKVVVPLNPGKNITVIAEVVAMTVLLRYGGVDMAAVFNENLVRKIRERSGLREYLRDDIE